MATKFRPLGHVLVRFKDDPVLLHHRLLLRQGPGAKWVVATPDRDVWCVDLVVGELFSEIVSYDGARLPTGIRSDKAYRDKDSEEGVFSPSDIQELVEEADVIIEKLRPDGRVPSKSSQPAGSPSKQAAAPAAVRGKQAGVSLGGWRVLSPTLAHKFCSTVDKSLVTKELVCENGIYGVFVGAVEEVGFARFVEDDWESMRTSFLADIGASTSPTPAAAGGERDVRVLDVIYDSADERWRTIEELVPEVHEEPFDDWPIEGPRTINYSLKQLRRQGESWLDAHERWVRRSGISSSDRAIHEHQALCRVLHLLCSYDQLNLPNLAGAEAANRRRALIEHAYASRPFAPDYSGSSDFLGNRDSQDGTLVDPALTQFVARRQGHRAEILKSIRLSKEEAVQQQGGGPGPKGPGGGKGGGKNKDGKEKDSQ